MGRLAGKVAFITGTAGGQGRAAALLFAKEGARVIGCDINSGEETVEMVRAQGGRMESTSQIDLSDPQAAKRWIDDGVEKAGRIDILYNNAAAARFEFMAESTLAGWAFSIRNGLDLVFNAVHAAWPHFLKQKGGVILSTASGAAHRGTLKVGTAAYGAAKGGVIALTKQLAAEGAPIGVRANTLSIGIIITPGLAHMSPEQLDGMEKAHPIGRAGRPEDIANCALYLVSDEAGWVTGSDFVLDGGMSSIV